MTRPEIGFSERDIFPTISTAQAAGLPPWHSTNDHYDRGYDEHSESLGLDFEIFAGKRILDIGSGVTARLAREAADHDVDVLSINPQWSLKDHTTKEVYPGSVAAVVEALPFANDSFDFAFSFWGIPCYLPGTPKAFYDAFSSIQRVLKPDSWALLSPVPKVLTRVPAFHEILESIYSADNYQLIKTEEFPLAKLVIYNEVTIGTRNQIESLLPSMAAARFSVW